MIGSSLRPIRLALVGAGRWARQKHLPVLDYLRSMTPGGFALEIVALCERQEPAAREAAAEYRIPKVFASVEALVEEVAADAYAVAVRPTDLPDVLGRLAPMERPLLTEKPPGLDAETAGRLAETVNAPNVVGFNRRYFPIVERFRDLLGDSADIYYVEAWLHRHERHDSSTYRAGGSWNGMPFIAGTAVHTINTLEYLFGPIAVVSPAEHVDRRGEPFWLVDFVFDSGVRGRLNVLPCSGVSTERIQAHGTERSLEMRYSMYSESDRPGRIEVFRKGGAAEVIEGDPGLPWQIAEGFVGGYLDLFRLVSGGGPARSTLATSVNTMRVAAQIEAVTPSAI